MDFWIGFLYPQDVAWKVALQAYECGGYSHILKNIIPQMRAKAMTEERINTMKTGYTLGFKTGS